MRFQKLLLVKMHMLNMQRWIVYTKIQQFTNVVKQMFKQMEVSYYH